MRAARRPRPATRNASIESAFASQIARAVARSEHEPVQQSLIALGREDAHEPEQRGEDERDPEEPVCGEVGALGREGRSGRRRAPRRRRGASRAACRARAARAGGPCASAWRRRGSSVMRGRACRSQGARGEPGRASRRGRCVRRAAPPAAVEQLDALGVEGVERLVEERAALARAGARGRARAAAASRARTSAARSFRALQRPKRSSSIPIRSRRSGTR